MAKIVIKIELFRVNTPLEDGLSMHNSRATDFQHTLWLLPAIFKFTTPKFRIMR
jgi:hypothetical protein